MARILLAHPLTQPGTHPVFSIFLGGSPTLGGGGRDVRGATLPSLAVRVRLNIFLFLKVADVPQPFEIRACFQE